MPIRTDISIFKFPGTVKASDLRAFAAQLESIDSEARLAIEKQAGRLMFQVFSPDTRFMPTLQEKKGNKEAELKKLKAQLIRQRAEIQARIRSLACVRKAETASLASSKMSDEEILAEHPHYVTKTVPLKGAKDVEAMYELISSLKKKGVSLEDARIDFNAKTLTVSDADLIPGAFRKHHQGVAEKHQESISTLAKVIKSMRITEDGILSKIASTESAPDASDLSLKRGKMMRCLKTFGGAYVESW